MKLHLDENIPRQLKRDISENEVFTVRRMGLNGKLNGGTSAFNAGREV